MNVLYSFDTSAWINGRRDIFRPTTFPTLWTRIEGMIAAGRIQCVDVVRDELSQRDDDVKEWARAQSNLFVPLDRRIQAATRATLRSHGALVMSGKGRNHADPFVIALARVRGCAVVSQEKASGKTHKPRIPDVCTALNVRCIDLADFVDEQGWSF